MTWRDIPWNPTCKLLKEFAALGFVFFTLMGAWFAFGKHLLATGWALIGIGLGFGLAGLVQPRLLHPIFVGWTVLVFPIGWLVLHACLAAMYYGLFTPVGLLFRLIGRDPLALRQPHLASYWTAKPAPKNVKRYYYPF